jgi:S1-C subfamily serine protease
MRAVRILAFIAVVLFGALSVSAASTTKKITLNDGTVLEGAVIQEGDSYWVKLVDGSTRMIPIGNVKSMADTDTTTATPVASCTATKVRAEAVDNPAAAVAFWQQFIDNNPASPDMAAAQAERARWQTMVEDGAERIRGKWVVGDALRSLHDQAETLNQAATDLLNSKKTLQAIDKLKEADSVYPNSYVLKFRLGYVSMLENKMDDAVTYLERANQLHPNNAAILADLGVALIYKHDWERSITCLQNSAVLEDNAGVTQDLMNVLALAPLSMRESNQRIRPAVGACDLLAKKYKINGPTAQMALFGLKSDALDAGSSTVNGAASLWSGTGFIVNDQGLILTNRHVVDGARTLMVVMSDRSQTSADIVVVDKVQDLALIRMKAPPPLGYLRLAPADLAGDGAECTVIGYPAVAHQVGTVKITRGVVSSATVTKDGADILTDAKINPGNSGGPILDKNGNVLAIACMKTLASATEDSFGLGISTGHIRQFLTAQKISPAAGSPAAAPLSTEEIVTQAKPYIVMIMAAR